MAIGSIFDSILNTAGNIGNRIVDIGANYNAAYADPVGFQRMQQQKQLLQQEERNNRELASIIASPVSPGQKAMMFSRIGTPAAVQLANQAMNPDIPASIREFQAVQQMQPDQRKQFMEFNAPKLTPYQQQQLEINQQRLDLERQKPENQLNALKNNEQQLRAAGRNQEADAVREQISAMMPPRKLSPTEQKEFYEAGDIKSASERVISNLTDAMALNNQAYSGVGAETLAAANRIPGLEMLISDKRATATTEMSNIITGQALENLKAMFGAAPTEGERKILLDLQASVNKTPQERAVILERAQQMAQSRLDAAQAKMEGITTGDIYSNSASKPKKDAGGTNSGWSVKVIK